MGPCVSAGALFVVRHAPVAFGGVCYGQSDVATTLSPESASEAVIGELERDRVRIDRVWTSPWRRTREPAAALAAWVGVPLSVDARLAEIAFGEWEGRTWAELEKDARFKTWMRTWQESGPPGGERLADFIERVRSWRTDALARVETALAWTHAGVIRVLRADSRGVGYEAIASESVESLKIERVEV
jgi:broad specificity phosphatase PhoE